MSTLIEVVITILVFITCMLVVVIANNHRLHIHPPIDWKHELNDHEFDDYDSVAVDNYVQQQYDIYYGGTPEERIAAGFTEVA